MGAVRFGRAQGAKRKVPIEARLQTMKAEGEGRSHEVAFQNTAPVSAPNEGNQIQDDMLA